MDKFIYTWKDSQRPFSLVEWYYGIEGALLMWAAVIGIYLLGSIGIGLIAYFSI